MRWLNFVSRDPVPWLLDPENPSSRFLTLRDIFNKDDETIVNEQARILEWEPIIRLRSHWDPVNHWGRTGTPYYGGSVGSFGSLHMLQQIGAPSFPEALVTCEALLSTGMTEQGIFSPEKNVTAPWLCYTGIALNILTHFGYEDDPRVKAVCKILVQKILLTYIHHQEEIHPLSSLAKICFLKTAETENHH